MASCHKIFRSNQRSAFLLVVSWILAASIAHAGDFAVLQPSASTQTQDKSYQLGLLDSERWQLEHLIDLGAQNRQPVLEHSVLPDYVQVLLPIKGSRLWDRVAYNTITRQSIPMGQAGGRDRQAGESDAFWYQHNKQTNIFASLSFASSAKSSENGAAWQLTGLNLTSGESLYSRNIGDASIVKKLVVGDLLIVLQKKLIGTEKYRLVTANMWSGEIVNDQRFSSATEPLLFASSEEKHFYLVVDKEIRQRKPNERGVKEWTSGELSTLHVYGARQGRLLAEHRLGYSLTKADRPAGDKATYFATLDSLVKGGVSVWNLDGDQLQQLSTLTVDCEPTWLHSSGLNEKFTLRCGHLILGAKPNSTGVRTLARARRVTQLGAVDSTEDLLYLVTDNGDCASKLSVSARKLSRCKATGREGVKVGQVLTAAAVGAASLAVNPSFLFLPILSYELKDEDMFLSDDNKHLFVHNKRTYDVTVFDAQSMRRLGAVAVGLRSEKVFDLPDNPWLFSVGERSLVAISGDGTAALSLRDGRTVGVLAEENLAFYERADTVQVIDLDTLDNIQNLPSLIDAQQIMSLTR